MASESTSVPHTTESHFVSFHRAHRSVKSEPHPASLMGFLRDEDLLLTSGPSSYHRLDRPTLPSDHRNSKVSPAISSPTRKEYFPTYRQDVLPLNPSNALSHPPVSSTSQNGFSQLGITSSSSPLNNPPNSKRLRTTPPVFHNVSDLAAHHGIPQYLPPAPRAVPRRSSADSSMSPTPEIEDFTSLCSEYLNMLSQDSVEPRVANDNQTTSQPPVSEDQEALRAIIDVLMPGTVKRRSNSPYQSLTFESGVGFLTSPMESPLDDFLSTPGQKHDDFGSEFSPLIVDNDGGAFDSPLFHDVGLFEPPLNKRPINDTLFRPPSNFDGMYTISPATPALEPSHLMRPKPAPSLSRPSNVPNGTRKNVTPDSLVPLDAPVQPRRYLSASATSRKDELSRKRGRSQAFDDDDDDEEEPQEGSSKDLDVIAAKRLQNTLAARRSRKRKLEYQRELETALDLERAEKEQWKARAVTLEALLMSHRVPVPPALNF
jgi:hypothetical protein